MLTRNANGYLLAVALFLVCCWVNPNDAIPYRIRPQAEEQFTHEALIYVDHRVGNRAETSAVNAHRAIGHPDLAADKKPAMSGGGKKWRSSQHPRSPRSRIKNVNVNVNRNAMGRADHSINRAIMTENTAATVKIPEVTKPSMDRLTTETVNCSESHNANDRYSSSFNGNLSNKAINVGDDFKVTGEVGTKKTSSVHVGEDITLCWIETTTIKEDHSLSPVQRFVIREYTISFENSATIPERYLECIQLEGEVDGKNSSVPRSALFEVMDENTRHSRVVNFTTVSHTDDLTVWQHRRVRCGVGPVVTKNIIEWAEERSDNSKKRVEIKVSPKIHRLTAQPTETEPCTTDLVDLQLPLTTPKDPASPGNCGPGTTCDSYSDCADGDCGPFTTSDGGSTSSSFEEKTTQLHVSTSRTDKEIGTSTTTNDDHESDEVLSTGVTKEQPVVTDGTEDSSEEWSTVLVDKEDGLFTEIPVEMITFFEGEPRTTTSATESSSVLSVTLAHESDTDLVETGNQEVDKDSDDSELEFSKSESVESCESGESCADDSLDTSTTSGEESSTDEMEEPDSATRREGETRSTEQFTVTPMTRVSSTQKTEITNKNEADYLSMEDSVTNIEIPESDETTEENDFTITEYTRNSNTITDSTQSSVTLTPSIAVTETTENSVTTTETLGSTVDSSECDPMFDDCSESSETLKNDHTTESAESVSEATIPATMKTFIENSTAISVTETDEVAESVTDIEVTSNQTETESGVTEFSTTEMTTIEIDDMGNETSDATTSTAFTTEVSTTDETTTQKPSMESCESGEDCESSSEDESSDNNSVTGGPSWMECDEGNNTAGCTSSTQKPGLTTEMVELKTTDVTEMTQTMTTAMTIYSSSDGVTVEFTTPIVEMTTEQTATSLSGSTTEISVPSITDDDSEITVSWTEGTTQISIKESSQTSTEGSTQYTTQEETRTEGSTQYTTQEETWTEGSTQYTTQEEIWTEGSTQYTTQEETWTEESTRPSAEGITESSTEGSTQFLTDEVTGSSTEEVIQTSTENYPGGSTSEIGKTTTSTPAFTTDGGVEETTRNVVSTTLTESDIATTKVTTPASNLEEYTPYTQESTTIGIIETVSTTTDADQATTTHIVVEGSTTTTTVAVGDNEEVTAEHSTVSSTVTASTTEEPESSSSECDSNISDCDTTELIDVTPITLYPCDSESESCDSNDDSTDSSCDEDTESCSTDLSLSTTPCDEESGSCSLDASLSSSTTCDEESGICSSGSSSLSTTECDEGSGDCGTGSTSLSSITCDEESGDCTTGSSSISTTLCDEDSSSSCTSTSEVERYSTSADSSEVCDNSTGSCTLPPHTVAINDLPATTISTLFEVENISTTGSDVPTTVESRRSTTVKAVSTDPSSKHKLALKIKILLEHIDENKKRQKLVEIEKHLLFNEHQNEDSKQSLMNQVRSLNNTVNMQTVQALFNCSTVEKLTGDVGDFAAKYLKMHGETGQTEGLANNFSSSVEPRVRKPRDLSPPITLEVDPNVEMSLPGIHADIHSGLSHVLTRMPLEHEVEKLNAGVNEEKIPLSRILDVVADPHDERVHARRKRQTIDDLTIDQEDLPKDIQEVGHWSNERVRRALNGGHVRTLTEFTIYNGP